jgi:WD40 repeat protein
MLRSHEPVSSMCLSFPRDNVSLLSPDVERCLVQGHDTCTPASMRVLSTNQPLDRTNFGLFQVNRLVGSKDSSDRFAIHMKVGSHENHSGHDEVLMIDSCRGEITQQIRNANHGGMSLCMSSYLDTMACYTTNAEKKQCISIYDVSRNRSDDIASRHDPFEYLSGKKRQLQRDEVSNDVEMNNDGLLRKLLPTVMDRYGIDSSLSCMAIDEYGASIVCGTSDGDMFLLNSTDLDGLTTQNTSA